MGNLSGCHWENPLDYWHWSGHVFVPQKAHLSALPFLHFLLPSLRRKLCLEWKVNHRSQHSPWNKVPQQTEEGQWCQGQPLWGQGLGNPICLWLAWAGARLHLHGRGEGTCLSPGKAFSWQEKKGKLSAQKAEHRRFNQQESLLIEVTWDLGEKGKRRAGTQSGFFFLLPKLLLGMVGRVERERVAWHKRYCSELMPTWYLRILRCRGGGEGWGLYPVPSRWGKMILSKPFAYWEQSTPLRINAKIFFIFCCNSGEEVKITIEIKGEKEMLKRQTRECRY